MEVKLTKRWLNHPKGTVIKSVSPAILKELKELGAIAVEDPIEFAPDVFEAAAKLKKERVFKSPPANKMIGKSPEMKEKAED